MKHKTEKIQLNNAGFSLLEVLIAMVILAIVSIPLLHSFVTVAKTNARAKIMYMATDNAENVMETFKYQDLETLKTLYTGSGNSFAEVDGEDPADDKKLVFNIKNPANFSTKMPDGYYMQVEMDPNMYPYANALNAAEMHTISATNSAVYRMRLGFDNMVYEEFAMRSANAPNGKGYIRKDASYFKKTLERTIIVGIEKDSVEPNGISVTMEIEYKLPASITNVLPSSQMKYTTGKKELFNNIASKTPLESVFIMYQPRYLANAEAVEKSLPEKEKIVISNYGNIKTNVYVVAQEVGEDVDKRNMYFNSSTGPDIKVVEGFSKGASFSEHHAALTLFTNFTKNAPYTIKDTSTEGELLCKLGYYNLANEGVTGAEASEKLNLRDLSGKQICTDRKRNRIYTMKVKVFNESNDLIVKLDGTKVD